MAFKDYLREIEEEKDDDVDQKIIDFFIENPNPEDDKVHALAKELGMEPDEFEAKIYAILSSFLSEGNTKGKKNDVDENELKMGIEVEKEHTSSPIIAEKIARDHLDEIADYYTRLKKMESEAESKGE
jgi:hypothetical protein